MSLLFAVALLASARMTNAQATEQIPWLVTHRGLDITVDYAARTIHGAELLTLRNESSRAADTVPLLLGRLMRVSGASTSTGAPLSLTQAVGIFADDPARQVNAVRVALERPVAPGDTVSLVVRYGGVLVGYTETGSNYIKDRVEREFTIIREDAYAFPLIGTPSWQALRAAPRGLFTFTARVTVPAGLVVAAGGEGTVERQADSLATWTYRSVSPAPYVNITIAPYNTIQTSVARIFYFPADSTGARRVERAITEARARFAQWYGSAPQGQRVVVMEIPDGFGSQSNLAAGVMQQAAAFRDTTQLPQLYHEISHLSNAEDADVPSARWNEGLASFDQYRMAEALDGYAGWEATIARVQGRVLSMCARAPACDALPFAQYGAVGATDRSYLHGMLMFYALYQVMGADAFDRAQRTFLATARVSGARAVHLASAFRDTDARTRQVFIEWFFTSQWYERLRAGETLATMIEGYRAPSVQASPRLQRRLGGRSPR